MNDPPTVLHWYDFLCPFCYVAQHRNAILMRHGLEVVELAFEAHPEVPPGGISAGPRRPAIGIGIRAPCGGCHAGGLVTNWETADGNG